jgi:branched-subunit amino acid aminotransferase/4-amino-4-deoxychorismate lyase
MTNDATSKVWLNGEIVDAAAACVSAFDAGFLHGVGLFETLRAYGGKIFRLESHYERLRRSAAALRLPLLPDLEHCRRALEDVLAANGLSDARLRVTVTPGQTQRPGDSGVGDEPTVLATATAVAAYPREFYEKGMTVLISRYRQSKTDPLAGHKTTSYWPRLAALREAHEARCGEALWFTPENLLAEACMSNVFVVRDDVVQTPPVDTPVLPGIVRGLVLELAADAGRPAREIPLTINDLLDADEVFLTNSVMEIMPVCRVERKPIADEKPGPVTTWVAEQYRKAVAG